MKLLAQLQLLSVMLLLVLIITAVVAHSPKPKVVDRCQLLGGVHQSQLCLPGTMLGLTNDKVLKYCCRLSNSERNKVKKKHIKKKGAIQKNPSKKDFIKRKHRKKKAKCKNQRICKKAGGRCVPSKRSCEFPITGKCEGTSCICCHRDKHRKKKAKCKNQRNCKKAGGRCIPSKRSCEFPITGKCEGTSCICCHRGCKKSNKCSKKGGVCSYSPCEANYTAENGCVRGCTCCVPSMSSTIIPGQCGKSNPSRIFGGQPVYPANKYPWHVWLLDSDSYLCGGAIIFDRYVLTAAHCICSASSEKKLKVVVADHNFDETFDDIAGVTQAVGIENVITHPDHRCSGSQINNDIALLVLSEPLDLCTNKEVRAVCLPPDDSSTYEGEEAIVTGWGLTDPTANKLPSELYEVTVPVLDPSCPGYNEQGIPLTDNMICAGVADAGLDSCSGDSGGPLMVNKDGSFVLIGIVSFGPLDCQGTGTYTRVSKFLKWIDENTSNGQLCT